MNSTSIAKTYFGEYPAHMARLTGKLAVTGSHVISANFGQQGFVIRSSVLKSLAAKLSKIASVPCDDLLKTSLPGSQPVRRDDCGQGESVSAGANEHRCLSTEGDDCTLHLAAHSGQLPHNPCEPLEVFLYLSRPYSTAPPAPSAHTSQNWTHALRTFPRKEKQHA